MIVEVARLVVVRVNQVDTGVAEGRVAVGNIEVEALQVRHGVSFDSKSKPERQCFIHIKQALYHEDKEDRWCFGL